MVEQAKLEAVAVMAGQAAAILRDAFAWRGAGGPGVGWHLLFSLGRVTAGFALAAAVAVPLGLVIGTSEAVARVVDPFVQVLRPVSPLAWLPVGLALLRDAERSAVFVIFICATWPALLHTAFAVRRVPRVYVDVARTLETRWPDVVRRVLWPAALPGILAGLRSSLGIAWMVVVSAEAVVGGRGIGFFVWNRWNERDLASILVAILLTGATGLALDRLFGLIERRVTHDE